MDQRCHTFLFGMAVASSLASPVLAGLVFIVGLKIEHVHTTNIVAITNN